MSVVCLHGLGRTAADWDGVRPALERFGPVTALTLARDAGPPELDDEAIVIGHSLGGVLALRAAARRPPRAVVLTGCFFPPARNGRSTLASLADYGAHRAAFVRGASPRRPARGTAGALGSLVRLAARRSAFAELTSAVRAPVLVVHARDDHHVPVDFALAARRPEWGLHVLEHGGHHAHVDVPGAWSEAVTAWLERVG